jgi:integrase
MVEDEAEAVMVGEAVGFEPEPFTFDGAGEVFFGHEFGGDRSDRISQLLQQAAKLLKLHRRQLHRPIIPPPQASIIVRLRIPSQPPTRPGF